MPTWGKFGLAFRLDVRLWQTGRFHPAMQACERCGAQPTADVIACPRERVGQPERTIEAGTVGRRLAMQMTVRRHVSALTVRQAATDQNRICLATLAVRIMTRARL